MNITITAVLSASIVLEPHPGAAALRVGDRIEVGAEIGSGGFGSVHRCDSISTSLSPGIVVKKHLDNGTVLAEACAGVLAGLQAAVDRAYAGTPAVARGLLPGIPYWVGRATWDGEDVVISLARDLGIEGLTAFDGILSDNQRLRAWLALDMRDRIAAACSFASGHALVEEFFVHADLNVENVFVDPAGGRAAVIDWDCGALPNSADSLPLSWGKPDDFVAPEAKVGQGVDPSVIGALTERWAVGYMVHYLLFGVGPLFFLKRLSQQDIAAYLAAHTWPDIDPHSPLFNTPNRTFYTRYLQDLADLPSAVVDLFRRFVTDGTTIPSTRPTSADWRDALEAVASPADFDWVTLDEEVTVIGEPVRVSWSAPTASAVFVNGGGPHPADGWLDVHLTRTGPISLEARNAFGSSVYVSDDVIVLCLPPHPQLKLDLPSFTLPRLVVDVGISPDIPAAVRFPRAVSHRLLALRSSVSRFLGRADQSRQRPSVPNAPWVRRVDRLRRLTPAPPSMKWRSSAPRRQRFGP